MSLEFVANQIPSDCQVIKTHERVCKQSLSHGLQKKTVPLCLLWQECDEQLSGSIMRRLWSLDPPYLRKYWKRTVSVLSKEQDWTAISLRVMQSKYTSICCLYLLPWYNEYKDKTLGNNRCSQFVTIKLLSCIL